MLIMWKIIPETTGKTLEEIEKYWTRQTSHNMKSSFLENIDGKNATLKQKILSLCINEGYHSIAELSQEINTSIPTTTKLVEELINDGFIEDRGKIDTSGGRRPSIYGLNASAGYLIGIDIRKNSVCVAIADFKGDILEYYKDIKLTVESSEQSFRTLCSMIKDHMKQTMIPMEKIMAVGVNLSGRVNSVTGYCFSYFIGDDRPVSTIFEEEFGCPIYVENDSRAMTYGEYIAGVGNNEETMLFINLTWGLGMGMIIDGKLSYGKSGFSGEIGHFPMLNNNIICHCGKTGCLETGASGQAAQRILIEKLQEGRASILKEKFDRQEEILIEDILNAVNEEDVLTIEVMEEIGSVLGRAIAGLINIFNPELVVIGGHLSEAKEYLMLPLKTSVYKHSLNMINKDTTIKLSKLAEKAGAIGACMLSRSKLLGLI